MATLTLLSPGAQVLRLNQRFGRRFCNHLRERVDKIPGERPVRAATDKFNNSDSSAMSATLAVGLSGEQREWPESPRLRPPRPPSAMTALRRERLFRAPVPGALSGRKGIIALGCSKSDESHR